MRRLLAVFLTLLLSIGFAHAEEQVPVLPVMQLHMIDAGTADAFLIMAGDTVILIDCGTDTDAHARPDDMLNYLAQAGFDHVDAYFVTHYHNDHAGNLDLLMSLYGSDKTIIYGPSMQLPVRFLPLPAGEYRQLTDGQELTIGDFHITCVGPEQIQDGGETNRDSLNFVLSYGCHSFLFTGDYAHGSLAARYPDLLKDIEVLKFPHHGLEPILMFSKTIKLVRPKIVLVTGNATWPARKFIEGENYWKPDAYYGPYLGNVVLLFSPNDVKVHTDVAPGTFTMHSPE